MKTFRVTFHHEDSGCCQTTFKVVGETRYFNRIDGDGWYTVYPSQGYWESSSRVHDDIVFEVVDGDAKLLFAESDASLGAFKSVGDKAREVAADFAARLNLVSYRAWRDWLLCEKVNCGCKDYYDDNWLYFRSKVQSSKTLEEYMHLGLTFAVRMDDKVHSVCGKKWSSVYIKCIETENTAAVCGFIFGD
jgi:hypothetical protein